MKSFGGARARRIRKSAKFDVMLILLVKRLHILTVLVNKPIHDLGMIIDAVVGCPIVRVGRNKKLVRPELVVVSEPPIPRKVLNGTGENPSYTVATKLIA